MHRSQWLLFLFGPLSMACAATPTSPPRAPNRATVAQPVTDVAPPRTVKSVPITAPAKAARLSDFRDEQPTSATHFIDEGYDVAFASDVDLMFVAKKRGGLLIRNGDVDRARPIGAAHFDRVGLSGDGKYAFAIDDRQRVALFSVDKGRILRTISTTTKGHPDAQFTKSGALVVYDGCQLSSFAIPAAPTAVRLGPKLCGYAQASADGRFWTIAEPFPNPASYLEGLNAGNVIVVDVEQASAVPLQVVGTEDAPIAAVRIDRSGKRLCVVDGEKRLSCQLTSELDRIPDIVSAPGVVHHTVSFDDTGDRVLYAVGSELNGPKTFFLHDFRNAQTQVLGASSAPELVFVGPEQLLEIGTLPPDPKLGATMYDLRATSRKVFFAGAETGGVYRSGGNDRRILIGKERNDTRDLYWVDVPR